MFGSIAVDRARSGNLVIHDYGRPDQEICAPAIVERDVLGLAECKAAGARGGPLTDVGQSSVESRQVFRGSLRWLAPEEEGLRVPFPADHWSRPAWIEPGNIQLVASLVVKGIVPGAPVSNDVEAYWLARQKIPAEDWTVRPGDILAVTEGPRAVAYLEVDEVVIAEH